MKETKQQPDWHQVHQCKVTENSFFLTLMPPLKSHSSLAMRLLAQNAVLLADYVAGVRKRKKARMSVKNQTG